MSKEVTRSYPKLTVKIRLIRLTESTISEPVWGSSVVMPTAIR